MWKAGEVDGRPEFGVVVLSLCTYRLSQPSVATLCSLFSLKRKIFLFSKFLPFRYLKTVVMMLMTSILLLLWKEKESCTPFMSAFYILFGSGFFWPQLLIFTSTIWVYWCCRLACP